MLAGTRYKGDDFEKARKLLSQIRQRPTLAIQENFERQFINMRFMTGCFIGLTGELHSTINIHVRCCLMQGHVFNTS